MPLTSTGAEIAVLEEIAEQPARARSDDHGVWLSQGLQPSGKVRRFTDDRLLLRRTLANQVADDHQSGSDPDPRLEFDGFDIEATDSVDGAQTRPDCPLGIVLMRARVAKIDQDAVAHVPGDEAVEPGDHLSDGAVIRGDDLAQILGIETRRESGRADQIAEHHRKLPTLCAVTDRRSLTDRRSPLQRRRGGKRRNRLQQSLAVAEHDSQLLKIGFGQLG